jgi:steroid 5-alpha reductase family enzyme
MNRTQSNIGTAVTLAVALLVAWVCSLNSLTISGIPLFGFCALIIFVIQYVIFIPSYLNQTEHFFDLTGSLTFISISILSVALSPNLSLINILLALMISIWAIRLGSFLFWRVRKAGEDKRFTIMKTKFSWFFMTWNIQGLWVLLSLGAALAAISSPKEVSFNVIHILGFLIWLTGFLIEVVADSQKNKI